MFLFIIPTIVDGTQPAPLEGAQWASVKITFYFHLAFYGITIKYAPFVSVQDDYCNGGHPRIVTKSIESKVIF